ncbi:MAG: YfiR family protein [Bacteroidia bacterium]
MCLVSLRFQQPSNFDTNAKIKAVFLYNFTRYFEWPDKKKTGNFVVYIVGKNENLITELKNLAAKKKVGAQDIEVKNSVTFDPSVSSQIIYLLPDVSHIVKDVTSKNKSKGTLIVAENAGACKAGSSINFLVLENKLKFEYSKNNAVKAGLKTNDDFKALAINVD